ncbi:MAG: ATP-dependent Clp protease ATP-binding subunit [bacterium]
MARSNISEKFNNHCKETIKDAIFLAAGEENILKPWHLFLSIKKQKGSIAAHLLENINISQETKIIKAKAMKGNIKISAEVNAIMEKAIIIACRYRHKYMGTEHILAGILEINDPYITDALSAAKIDISLLKDKLKSIFENLANFPAFFAYADMPETLGAADENRNPLQKISRRKKNSYLNNFCVILTDGASQKEIDPVIGREKEIKRLIQILARRNKNNPILIGEAGVGKTAIIEGLAKKIIEKNVPLWLSDKKIVSLDINSLVAGTIFRGEFETRLKNLIDELSNNDNIIIFIDEIHNIVGAGSASGAMDIANIIKPALAKGNIKFIGATTFDEYKKYIEKDPALERRFQPIIIEEPSVDDTIEIVKGIKENYENFHNINISCDAVEAAVKLSHRYIQDRLLPDKAIDLLDEAASKYKLDNNKTSPADKIKKLEADIIKICEEKEANVFEEKFELAIKCKEIENKIQEDIIKLENELKTYPKSGQINKKDIYETVSAMINIPQKNLDISDYKKNISELTKSLKEKIIGQDDAINKITNTLKRGITGISSPHRPLGSFLFLGPSGTGKTELAKVLAEELFNNKNSLIRIDMGEYAESFNVSKLIGAPAGYIGFEQGGILTEKIRKNPYSVILFDEIDKAHKSSLNLLLQILEDGALKDASGRFINFKNALIIMTSNLGIERLDRQANIGFELNSKKEKENFKETYSELKARIMKEVADIFPVEFLARIDNTVVFNALTFENMKDVVAINLNEISYRLKALNLNIEYDKKLIEHLAKESVSYKQGARPIRKITQEKIEDVVADKLINGEIKKGDTVKIVFKNGGIKVFKNSLSDE